MKPHGPWKIVASQSVYRDPWVELIRDDVIRPDGRSGTFSVLHVKAGVSVLPLDDDGGVYLTEEFHYGVGRTTIEVVSGGIDQGESPLEAARRELREELGIEASRWESLGQVDPFTSNVVSPTELFLARDLRFTESEPEGTEQIRRIRVPLRDAVERVMTSRITHSASCIVILKAARILGA